MRQVAERLTTRGHDVTVATSALASRDFDSLNGVRIKEFAITGNLSGGMAGEVDRYRDYLVDNQFDVMMVKAAQQWTFDATWPVLDKMKMSKVFIPCGFNGLYEPDYASYYQQMPEVLRRFNQKSPKSDP